MKCQTVNNSSKHSHLIALNAVKSFGSSTQSAENISTSNDNSDLNTHCGDFGNLYGIFFQSTRVNALF
jgi:hypothetical protein